ncbi:MAG: ribbon-helix-helix domain-containing protein [Cohaesibacteraceae bacterium]|nr:ribbon-helix-helix domain-containing protein [Cohaesibacteraceae bacterium]
MKRSVTIAGHRTSLSLEDEFWDALHQIAKNRQLKLADIVREIDSGREKYNLSSAIRVAVLKYYQAQT